MTEHPQTPPQQGAPYTPQPLSPTEERNLGLIAHLVPAVLLPLSAGTLGFLGSLVIYLMYKDRGPFVRQHAANSLNVQIITAILLLATVALLAGCGRMTDLEPPEGASLPPAGSAVPPIWTEHPASAAAERTASAVRRGLPAFILPILPRGAPGSGDARVEP